jgi:hypothetical protein
MKSKTAICLLVFVMLFFYAGCVTSPVTYSFAAAGDQNSSSISFKNNTKPQEPNVTFVSFNGQTLPKPDSKTHWDPLSFPSGRELRIIIHADYRTSSKTTLGGFGLIGDVVNIAQDIRAASRNVDADVIFVCPPLEAGKSYLLSFTKEPGLPGKNILTLTDVKAAKVVVQQEFQTSFGGDNVK